MILAALLVTAHISYGATPAASPPPSSTINSDVSTTESTSSMGAGLIGNDSFSGSFDEVGDVIVGSLAVLNPSISYSVRYGDGISYGASLRESTTMQQLSPSIRINAAERFTAAYTPSFTWYSSDNLADRVNHRASLKAVGRMGITRISFTQTYSSYSAPLIETAEDTKQAMWGTNVGFATPLGARTNLDLSFGRQSRSTQRFTDVVSWSGFAWLRYRYSQAVGLAVGAGGSYNEVNPGADMYSRDLRTQVTWAPGSKLSVSADFGLNISGFSGSGRGNITSPVYGVAVRYALTSTTVLSVSAHKVVSASYFRDQLTESSRHSINLNQRLFEHFMLNVGVGHSDSQYVNRLLESSREGPAYTRWSYSARISTRMFDRIGVAAFWQSSENDSAIARYDYGTTIVGMSLHWSL